MATMEGVKGWYPLLFGVPDPCSPSPTDLRQKSNMIGEMREFFAHVSEEKALEWLHAVDPEPLFDFNKEQQFEGTCEWFYAHER